MNELFKIHGAPGAWEFFFETSAGDHLTDGEIHGSYLDCLEAAKQF